MSPIMLIKHFKSRKFTKNMAKVLSASTVALNFLGSQLLPSQKSSGYPLSEAFEWFYMGNLLITQQCKPWKNIFPSRYFLFAS